jgi:PD-(D/E)XK nuclease superfamily
MRQNRIMNSSSRIFPISQAETQDLFSIVSPEVAEFDIRLGYFLDQARPMLQALARVEAVASASLPKIDVARFATSLTDLGRLFQVSRSRGEGLNPWAVAGLRHYEVRNVGVLASLWDPQLCGDEAIKFLNSFLSRIPTLDNDLRERVGSCKRYWVRTEDRSIAGEQSRRADVTIEGDEFFLIVEVKIYASESGEGQYQDCVDAAERWSGTHGKPAAFILLALSNSMPKGYLGHYATWADVAAAARTRLPRSKAVYTYHSHLLENFVRHISNF